MKFAVLGVLGALLFLPAAFADPVKEKRSSTRARTGNSWRLTLTTGVICSMKSRTCRKQPESFLASGDVDQSIRIRATQKMFSSSFSLP